MAISGPIAAAVIAGSATVYSANSSRKAEEESAANSMNIAQAQIAASNKIAAPGANAASATLQASEQRAASAGGTITPGGQNQQMIGDGGNGQRKSLIGT